MTNLDKLLDGGVNDHERSVDQVHHAVANRDVGLDHLGHHNARGVFLISDNRVTLHNGCNR